jgi:hypothetical protein
MPRISPCRGIRLYVALALLAIGRIPGSASAAQPPPSAPAPRPLRAQDWDLAWQAFVGAGAVEDAYRLAQRAVAERPNSRLWLGRLAQAARWSNHPQAALGALSRLALQLHEDGDLVPALDLAIGLGDEEQAAVLLRSLMQQGRATAAQRRMLSGLYLDIGEPHRAIRQLQRQFSRTHDPKLLWEQAVIYRTLGDPQRELATFERYRKDFGPGPKVMLAIATIDYVQNRLPQAFAALRAARSRARPADTAYWQTLSGLAWLLGDYPVAARAAKVLIATDKADASVYLRVVYAEQYRHPRQAFSVAARGWQRTREPALFLSMLGIASSLHPATDWLARAFAMLGPGEGAAFKAIPAYWTSLAALHAGQGKMGAAVHDDRRALRDSPDDEGLLADFLWLLVDHHDLAPFSARLPLLARRARQAPQLWAPLAAAYAALQQPQLALPWLQAQWSTRKNDPLWLIDYADTLQQAGRPAAAWQLRRRAYDLLSRRLASRSSAQETQANFLALARLATSLAPGDPARRAIEALARQSGRQEARLTVLAWMQSGHAYSLARWWSHRAFVGKLPPDGARLAQAIGEHDGPTIAHLLDDPGSTLPLRERAGAADALGWKGSALTLTFQGLALEPRSAGLQRQFAAIAVPRADSFGGTAIATETSGLLDAGLDVQASHWLSPRNQLEIRVDTIHQRTLDSSQFGTPPALSRAALIAWRHASAIGSLRVDIGAGRNLASWSRAGIEWRKRWTGDLETTLGAVAGARPLDTAALGVAGLEDHIDAGASIRMGPRTQAQLQLQAGRLRAQGGGTLGSVQRFSLAGDYQLWFSPPDFALDASLSGAHYARAASLPAQLTPLVPAEESATVGFFVPDSFAQLCAGGHFNMRYATTYTPLLRPYAGADLCDNTVSGRGYDLTAGVATPVSGPDHLSLSVNLENDVGTHSGRTAGVMLRYRHYFTSTQ